jgi:hypothetical protein
MKRIILILLVATGIAHADKDAVVVAIDGSDIYVDLGARDGVGAGSELELLHEVVAKDPRTGAMLRDRFALGQLTVEKSGDKISVAHAADGLKGRVLAGDHVRRVSPPRTFVDPWAERAGAAKAATPAADSRTPGGSGGRTAPRDEAIDHEKLARAAWEDTLGKPLEERVARWLELMRADPMSPYRAAVQREIAALKDQITKREAALANAKAARPGDRSPRIAELAASLSTGDLPLIDAPIKNAIAGEPIALAFVVRVPASTLRAWLFARPRGGAGFTRTELVADGDAYLRGTIAGELVHGRAVEWYVEVAGADGDPVPVLGSQSGPRVIAVEPVVAEPPIAQGRSHIDAHVDFVDFDGKLGKGFDQYYQAEIDFSYRFLEPVYAVRLGFGTLNGIGGPKDIIDADPTDHCLDGAGQFRCTRVTFSYVYTEVELKLRQNAALMLRPQAGLLTSDDQPMSDAGRCNGADIAQCRFRTGLGARARLRLGEDGGTNLILGAGFNQGIGTLLEAAYTWRPTPVVPVQLSVQVTDQPVPEDFGVRLIADVGWRSLAWFYPSARLSYQARDIDHSGVSGGVAMNFDW